MFAATHHVALLVELQVAEREHAVGVLASAHPPQDRAHPDDQLLDAERLGHVVVATEREPAQLVVESVPGREEEHGHRRGRAVPRHSLHDLEPAQVREHHVEHHQVRPEVVDPLECLAGGVGDADVEALVAQSHREQVGDALLVVHDQDRAPALWSGAAMGADSDG